MQVFQAGSYLLCQKPALCRGLYWNKAQAALHFRKLTLLKLCRKHWCEKDQANPEAMAVTLLSTDSPALGFDTGIR